MTVKNNISSLDYYQNWKFIHPDGFLMFYSDERKANWYLSRSLAELVDEKTVKFKFRPKIATRIKYNLSKLETICVVCGSNKNLSRHHVVPYVFKKHMPEEIKSHSHHDVLLLCRKHHDDYELISNNFKKQLFEKFSLNKLQEKDKIKIKVVKQIQSIKKIEALVFYKNKEKAISIIKEKIASQLNMSADEIDIDSIYYNFNQAIKDRDFHKLLIEKTENLHSFIKMWRMHFVETMNPQYLPKNWDINYQVKG